MTDTQRQAPQPPPQPWFDPKTGNATEAFRRYLLGEFSAATQNVNSGVAQAQAAAAEEIGWPVVCKPQDGNQGKGVTVNITTKEHLTKAYAIATPERSPAPS